VRSFTSVVFLAAAVGAAGWTFLGTRHDRSPTVAPRPIGSARAPDETAGHPPAAARAAEALRLPSPRATAAVAPASRPKILPIQHPYPARADQLPVSYAPGVAPNPQLERRVAEREVALRQDHWGMARQRPGNHGRHAATAAKPSAPTK
jgi:hypothetical protein